MVYEIDIFIDCTIVRCHDFVERIIIPYPLNKLKMQISCYICCGAGFCDEFRECFRMARFSQQLYLICQHVIHERALFMSKHGYLLLDTNIFMQFLI